MSPGSVFVIPQGGCYPGGHKQSKEVLTEYNKMKGVRTPENFVLIYPSMPEIFVKREKIKRNYYY